MSHTPQHGQADESSSKPSWTLLFAVAAVVAVVAAAVTVLLTDDSDSDPGSAASSVFTSAPTTTATAESTVSQAAGETSSSTTEGDTTTAPPTGDAACQPGSGSGENNDGVGFCVFGPPFDDPDFFPIAVFSANSTEAERFAEEGFNMLLTGGNPPDRLPSFGGPKDPPDMQKWIDQDMYVFAAYDMAEPLSPSADSEYLVGFGTTDEPIKNFGLTPDQVGAQVDSVRAVDGFAESLGFTTFAGHTLFYEPRGTNPDVMEETREVSEDPRIDLLAFDIYPVSYCSEEGFFRIFEECTLSSPALGIDHFQRYSDHTKPVLSWTDARFNYGEQFPDQDMVQFLDALVWQPINHGSRGVAWFTIERGTKAIDYLDNPEVATRIREINGLITSLAPVLNSPGVDTATATTSDDAVTMDLGGRVHGGKTYIFAVADADSLGDGPSVTATFVVDGLDSGTVTELKSGETLDLSNGEFDDDFDPYEVKIYEIDPA